MSAPKVQEHALDFSSAASAVEASMGAWHSALEAHDWAAVAAGLTPGFLMVEHDRIMDKASLLALVMSSASLGRQRASLHEFRTVVRQDSAWTTLRNDELWIANDGNKKSFRFLETAIFRLERGAWLIDRYHATRLTPDSTLSDMPAFHCLP
jgi:ketosteroid isomerase-like protein